MAVEASKMKLYKLRDIFVMQVWRLDTKMLTDTEILQIRGLLVKTVLRFSSCGWKFKEACFVILSFKLFARQVLES